jgi:predicted porin
MQKKLIALAITAAFASAPAFADVSVYGKLDAGLGSNTLNAITTAGADGPKTTTTAIAFSQFFSSRLGFKAKEALSNGMSVSALVETGIGGATTLGSREENLTLDFGQGTTVKGGYGTTTMRNIVYSYDGIYGANIIGNLLNDTKNKNGLSTELTKRSTSVEVGQNFGAVKATLNVMVNNTTLDNSTPDTKVGSGFEIGATYGQDALSLAGAYRDTKDSNPAVVGPPVVNASDKTNKAFILGAAYDFGVVSVKGTYANVTVDDNLAGTSVKNNGETIGAYLPISSALTGFGNLSFAKNTTTDQKSTGYALGVKYDMSKNTFGYAELGATKLDNSAAVAGQKATQFSLGLVQSF